MESLRGCDSTIGSGSQVASQKSYGTLGCIVRSLTPEHELGFLTNRHVAVDLDHPHQKMFHPLPPSLGPGVYLGSVERATSFITDDLWYGVFASLNEETYIRADGAFTPFAHDFDLRNITADLKGVGEMGDIMRADLTARIDSIIGKQVLKVGRSSGLTKGVIRAYAVEYNDEEGICYFTDFLVIGEKEQSFDFEGDSGSLIIVTGEEHEKPRPFGIIWGGTANRGRLKLGVGRAPENWTSCVDLGRLLDLLQLELINTKTALKDAIEEHREIHQRNQLAEDNEISACDWEYDEAVDLYRSPSKTYAPPEEVLHLQRIVRKANSPSSFRRPVQKASPSSLPSWKNPPSTEPPEGVVPTSFEHRKQIKDEKSPDCERESDVLEREGKRKRQSV
ncbi:hypothetical protein MPTK1_6g20080 [Marchantia polymorpha subsp. ruderalis]|nr:hypothetical protein MARPO_0045s0056 [Marchantia polymorpha]BBN15501.1 hypothetical protein Mp_6g20080 [Marchantia polymorpha subsp. ruderalis]|eukprot:PTQ39388.1 hypothetical protein MARPO_0045s0056 [Marchantia polymorpha]